MKYSKVKFMLYQVVALLILASFYGFYIAKIIRQRKHSIKTNQVGSRGKTKKVMAVEITMSAVNTLNIAAEVISIFLTPSDFCLPLKVFGIAVGVMGVLFFALATVAMKNNWRVGIPEEKTNVVTNGIYRFSRNPAFLGFYLLYISILLLFFNAWLLIISVLAMILLHIQVLQEENWLSRTFGEEYEAYRAEVRRYFGRK